MPFRVSRETLLLLAGLFWTLAGVNVLRLGIRYWMDNPGYFLFKLSEMLVIFFVFLGFIFQNLYRKHTLRIIHKPEKNLFFGGSNASFKITYCQLVIIDLLLFHNFCFLYDVTTQMNFTQPPS